MENDTNLLEVVCDWITVKIAKILEGTAEILGLVLFFLPIIVQILLGVEISDILFIRVIRIVNFSVLLRNSVGFLFYGMLLLILTGIYFLNSVEFERDNHYIFWLHVVLRIITGWIIGTWMTYSIINTVFYRDAVLVFPYWLGGLLLLITVISVHIDKDLSDSINKFRNREKYNFVHLLGAGARIGRYIVISLLGLIIIIPTIVPLSGLQPSPPANPDTFGGEREPFEVRKIRVEHDIPQNISSYLVPDNANSSWYIFLYLPELQTARQIPLTIYAHGYTGTDPKDYENTLYQLAARGNAVIFTQYVTDVKLGGEFTEPAETNFTSSNAMYFRYLMEWSGILQAVTTLQEGSDQLSKAVIDEITAGSRITADYMQIIGHSVGGGMVPYLATQVVNHGWARQQLVLDMETPWFAADHPNTAYNLSILPDTTIVNIVGSEDDHLASPCIGMDHFEEFFISLPKENLSYLIIPSDYYGFPRLVATHYVVTSTLDDTLTRWGYMKRVDAMAAYLGALANDDDLSGLLSYFTGGTDMMLSQGAWSDGTPVNPLIYSIDPYGIREGDNLATNYIDAHAMGPEICTR